MEKRRRFDSVSWQVLMLHLYYCQVAVERVAFPFWEVFAPGFTETAAVGIVYRQWRFTGSIETVAVFQRNDCLGFWSVLRPFSHWCPFVKVHRTAGTMDDKNAFLTQVCYNFVNMRSQLGNTLCCRFTPVPVPHITDYYNSFFRIPLLFSADNTVALN